MIHKNSDNNIDIVVISCDNYSDVWPHFFNSFFKNWEDCPLGIYLISNKKNFNHKKVKNINIGEDTLWSANLKKGIKNLKKDYALTNSSAQTVSISIVHTTYGSIFAEGLLSSRYPYPSLDVCIGILIEAPRSLTPYLNSSILQVS